MPFPLIPVIAAGAGLLSQFLGRRHAKRGAQEQHSHNMALARFQDEANRRYLQQQLDYNTPKSQMARFQEAGLNPHLIYGQGNPGNQSQSLSYPEIKAADIQSAYQMLPLANQTAMTATQIQAMTAKTRQTYVVSELNKLQAEVLKKNPLLDDAGFRAIIDSLKATAQIKAEEVKQAGIATFQQEASAGWVVKKLEAEVLQLEQRFKLQNLDEKIKAQVLTSMEFRNAILEIQKKFMADGDIGPQQILQFVQLLLMKAL